MKFPSELFNDPPHERDLTEPCFACGAKWEPYGPAHKMVHAEDCLYHRFCDLPEILDEDAPLNPVSAQWLIDATKFFANNRHLLDTPPTPPTN